MFFNKKRVNEKTQNLQAPDPVVLFEELSDTFPLFTSINTQTITGGYLLNKSGRTTSSGTSLRHLSLVTERFTPDY